jgi:hypothetical protein
MAIETNVKLENIYKKLLTVDHKEASLNTLEGLFYQALAVAREQEDNDLLGKLKKLESEEYKSVLERPQTKSRKEASIKTFKHVLKTIINEKR